MKKVITFIITLALVVALAAPACADFDLSGLSFEELVALREQVDLAIWNCEEWQEVTVPQGVWEVGTDIPEGKWTIRPLPDGEIFVYCGTAVKDAGTAVQAKNHVLLYGPENRFYKEGEKQSEWIVDLSVGDFLQIEDGYAVFSPYAGKPSLGFK